MEAINKIRISIPDCVFHLNVKMEHVKKNHFKTFSDMVISCLKDIFDEDLISDDLKSKVYFPN